MDNKRNTNRNNDRNSDTRKSRERRKKDQQIRQIRHVLIFTMLVILALMYAAAKKEVELKKVEEAGKTEVAAGKLESGDSSGERESGKKPDETGGNGKSGEAGESDKDGKAGSGKTDSDKFDKEKSGLEKDSSGKSSSGKAGSDKGGDEIGKTVDSRESDKSASGQDNEDKTAGDGTAQGDDGSSGDSLVLKDEDMWCLYLTNEHYPVPDNQQINLVQVPETEQTVDERIYEPLMKMIEDARAQGMRIHMCSGYRTKEKQTELFENKKQSYIRQGKTEEEAYNLAKRSISVPDSGEHRLGLAADFISDTYTVLEEGFADTPEGQWLREHCTEYGFILRYPKEKEEITGIDYEPWHFRYVGVKVAEYMKEHDMCLEEFYVAQSLYG